MRNRLLATLAPACLAALQPHLERQSLEQGYIAAAPDRAITHAFFPEPGVSSVVARMATGMRLEAGIIGPEGMTGLALLNGAGRSPGETFVQIPCRTWRVEAGALRGLLREHRAMHDHLLLYAQAFSVQVVQCVFADGRFTIGERLARWLLMCHGRADREDLTRTHEFLSLMLEALRRCGRRPATATACPRPSTSVRWARLRLVRRKSHALRACVGLPV